jgi:hypothetical protein
MHARTVEPSLQLAALTASQATDRLSNIPQLEINDHLGSIRGLFYAIVFQGILGLIVFAGWGLWRVLR